MSRPPGGGGALGGGANGFPPQGAPYYRLPVQFDAGPYGVHSTAESSRTSFASPFSNREADAQTLAAAAAAASAASAWSPHPTQPPYFADATTTPATLMSLAAAPQRFPMTMPAESMAAFSPPSLMSLAGTAHPPNLVELEAKRLKKTKADVEAAAAATTKTKKRTARRSRPPSKKKVRYAEAKPPRDFKIEYTRANRLVWTPELHELFLEAYTKLGENAVPGKIVAEMNIEGLSRSNVASHLQKYRLQLRWLEKLKDNPPEEGGLNGFDSSSPSSPLPPTGTAYSSVPSSTSTSTSTPTTTVTSITSSFPPIAPAPAPSPYSSSSSSSSATSLTKKQLYISPASLSTNRNTGDIYLNNDGRCGPDVAPPSPASLARMLTSPSPSTLHSLNRQRSFSPFIKTEEPKQLATLPEPLWYPVAFRSVSLCDASSSHEGPSSIDSAVVKKEKQQRQHIQPQQLERKEQRCPLPPNLNDNDSQCGQPVLGDCLARLLPSTAR